MNKEVVFGKKEQFGIRYVQDRGSESTQYPMAILHLVLRGQIIGDPSEPCLIGTWLAQVRRIAHIIETQSEKLSHDEFKGKSDEEIFELVFKSNQLPQQYNQEFGYLKRLENEVWKYCSVSIDETTDAYLIVMTALEDEPEVYLERLEGAMSTR